MKATPAIIAIQTDDQREVVIKIIKFTMIFIFILFMNTFGQENPHEEVPFSCETCHNTADWQTVNFDHSRTGFDLIGRHIDVDCMSCHNISNFSNINDECRSCHTDIHQSKLYPNCELCHTPAGWSIIDANQAHINTTFQIIGAHAKLDCGTCHQSEIVAEFRRPSSDCYDCHENEFLSAASPKHDLVTFGTRCEDCHSFIAWKPATFRDHDSKFPIFSGAHAGVWDDCTTCHTNPATYSDFTCLVCHAHNRASMDSKHSGRSGYSYDSNACYNCHPGGRGD